MQEGKLSFWHRVAHVLGLNSECASMHVENDYVVRGFICNDCGKSRDVVRLFKYSEENVANYLSVINK